MVVVVVVVTGAELSFFLLQPETDTRSTANNRFKQTFTFRMFFRGFSRVADSITVIASNIIQTF